MENTKILTLDTVKRQLLEGLTPCDIGELYTRFLLASNLPDAERVKLQTGARFAIQLGWAEVRKKAIFHRLKSLHDVREAPQIFKKPAETPEIFKKEEDK